MTLKSGKLIHNNVKVPARKTSELDSSDPIPSQDSSLNDQEESSLVALIGEIIKIFERV